MKRRLHYLAVAFFAIAAISWAGTALRWLTASAAGRTITVDDRLAAFNLGAASIVTMIWLAGIMREHWRAARRRMRPHGVVEIVLRVDRSKFDRELAAMKRASDELRDRMRANEAGVATLPAAATSIALFAVVLSLVDRSWLDALVFLALAGMAAAWTYLDTATEGRRT